MPVNTLHASFFQRFNQSLLIVDGDLAESIKHGASDRLGDLVP